MGQRYRKMQDQKPWPSVSRNQARSQKFAMGGCFGDLEAEPQALKNFAFFC